ncbi:MAG: di-trans,poly-cis-decaprenylcistransferase [Thermoleophilaceae bacterium]|jgi:undecaprenyl diphosphate synthase|nr:di-trans,poly-cis-decaprenylcistransferase [Thermoleophilaceae bacterium]MBA3839724.1 di-trans,poly-cis-decaprenylcistransferase [Thermoleophilaceae bacterium]
MAARRVAIIMDGNARWARSRGLPVLAGHREGARTLRRTVENAVRAEIEELTVYAFSTENWTRPSTEVRGLMRMFAELIESETRELSRQGVRMRFVGRREGVSARLDERMDWAEAETRDNERMTLFVAFNYGGRAEILDAARRFAGGDEEDFRRCLYVPDMGDPELLIRTSGEHRLSNFLLWQSAYSELVFSERLWPDFGQEDLDAALAEYASRERRFGRR